MPCGEENVANERFMTSLNDIDPEIRESVDYIVYDGSMEGSPSQIVDLTSGKEVPQAH